MHFYDKSLSMGESAEKNYAIGAFGKWEPF